MIIGCIMVSLACGAQSTDSLASRIRNVEAEQQRMKDELWRSHEKFRLGALITGVGLLFCGYEAVTWEDSGDLNTAGNQRTPTFAYIGAGLMLVGGVIMVDSHRHIGLAGVSEKPTKTWRPFKIKRKNRK